MGTIDIHPLANEQINCRGVIRPLAVDDLFYHVEKNSDGIVRLYHGAPCARDTIDPALVARRFCSHCQKSLNPLAGRPVIPSKPEQPNPSDPPGCDVCGSITVRSGDCHKCLNCGNSMGAPPQTDTLEQMITAQQAKLGPFAYIAPGNEMFLMIDR